MVTRKISSNKNPTLLKLIQAGLGFLFNSHVFLATSKWSFIE